MYVSKLALHEPMSERIDAEDIPDMASIGIRGPSNGQSVWWLSYHKCQPSLFGGGVPTFYAKFPTVPIFLDFVPIFLNSLMYKNSAILSPILVILTILNLLA